MHILSSSTSDSLTIPGALGGLTLAPGLYNWASSVSADGDVTIQGGSSDSKSVCIAVSVQHPYYLFFLQPGYSKLTVHSPSPLELVSSSAVVLLLKTLFGWSLIQSRPTLVPISKASFSGRHQSLCRLAPRPTVVFLPKLTLLCRK